VTDKWKLERFLDEALPEKLGPSTNELLQHIQYKEAFIEDALAAVKLAPMAIRLTPHVLSRIDWNNPLDDPIRRQFIPLASGMIPDTPDLKLDSLNEEEDSRNFAPSKPFSMLITTQLCLAWSTATPAELYFWVSGVLNCSGSSNH
jgi:hypothetical protein